MAKKKEVISNKDMKKFAADLKTIYLVPNEQ